jgi:hypothetical protein
MTKQTELRELLKAYRAELDMANALAAANHLAQHEQRITVDMIESRIFSLFDTILRDRDSVHRAASQNLKALEQVTRERDELKRRYAGAKPAAPANKPFDLEAAKRGEPVEVLYKGNWIEVTFVGVARGFPVLDSLQFDTTPSTWGSDGETIRMKSTACDVTMYANIYRSLSPRFNIGSLYETPNEAQRCSYSNAVVRAIPVTFTVAT